MVPAPVLKPLTPAGGPAPAPNPTPAPRPLPSRTGVDLDEWRVAPAYRELRAGAVEFNAANLGEDDHDFSVRDADGATLKAVPLAPGESAGVRLTLAAGTYTLYCSLPGHEELGMRARVTVR
jgi:plastocyanin